MRVRAATLSKNKVAHHNLKPDRRSPSHLFRSHFSHRDSSIPVDHHIGAHSCVQALPTHHSTARAGCKGAHPSALIKLPMPTRQHQPPPHFSLTSLARPAYFTGPLSCPRARTIHRMTAGNSHPQPYRRDTAALVTESVLSTAPRRNHTLGGGRRDVA